MYPGDPDGAPAEIYNCRCTMIGDLEDYPRENFQRYDNIEGKPIDYVTYKEWLAAKQKAANMTKLDDAQKKVDAIKDAIKAKGADPDKTFSGIWKDDVTYADWEDKKDAIQAKREYFQKQIQDKQQLVDYGVASSFDQKQLKKFKGLLDDLEEFEKNGPEFAPLFKQLKTAEDKVKSIQAADMAGTAFTEERKAAGLWAKTTKEYRDADKYFDPIARKVHATATRIEHKGYYEYTAGSGKFNRPLAGFRGWSWNPGNFVGPGKVNIDEDGFGDWIRGLTSFCEKSKYDRDFWVQSGQSQATLEGFLGVPYGTLGRMTEEQLQQFVGEEKIIPQFISGAINKGGGSYTPGNMVINIFVPKGSEALYVLEDGAFSKDEHEMILQRGGTYRITRIYWGRDEKHGGRKLMVDMELHPEKGYDKFQQKKK